MFNKRNLISLVVGVIGGYLGSKYLLNTGLGRLGGTRFYPYKTDWDTENRAKAIMQSLAGIPPGIMGDMPSSFYGGHEALPGWTGDPTWLDIHDPDGPKTPGWMWGFGPGGFGPPPPPVV
jgi:hypothetical protein